MAIKRIIGIAGVAKNAPYKAQVWGRRFERGLMLIFAWLLIHWYLGKASILPYDIPWLTSWIVWLYFLTELIVLTYMVEDRWRYLRRNWANWIVIIMGFPLILIHSPWFSTVRLLRVIIILRFIKPFLETSFKVLARRHWQSTMAVMLAMVIVSAFTLTFIDPAFKNVGEGLWFAWESVTTVGYGDIVPHTVLGRIFTCIIIIIGLVLISMMTASFSAFIIGNEQERKQDETLLREKIQELQQQLSRIEAKLDAKDQNP